MLRGMNPDNVVTTPTRKTRTTTMHPVEQREAPVSGQRNRQRTGRRDHGPVNYNTDQHPADEAIFGSSEDEEDEEDGSKSVRKSSAGGERDECHNTLVMLTQCSKEVILTTTMMG